MDYRATDHAAAAFDGWRAPDLDYPTFRLSLVAKILDRQSIRDLSRETDLSMAEWRVLARLATADGLTVRQISERAWVDRAEVSRAAALLETRGFTARRDNPRDRRTPILYMTDEGRGEYHRVVAIRQQFHEEILAGIAPERLRVLDETLRAIGGNLVARMERGPAETE